MERSKGTIATTIGCTTLLSLCMAAAHAAIQNPGFENDWESWTDIDPSAISGVAYSGSKSAKITGSGGRFEQQVSVQPNTDYRLTAYIRGSGTIGVEVGSNTYDANASNSDWQAVHVDFNSGNAQSLTVFGAYNGDEGRFDNFTLEKLGDSDGSSGSCTSGSNLAVIAAYDDGTNDGHGPQNVLDGSLADESRWSSQGIKWITLDLGGVKTVEAVDLAWYKGDQRQSFFYIETSTDNSNWTTVLSNGQSSGTTSDMERYDVTDTSARYVRLTGSGNTLNNWNSILEFDVIGCGDGSSDDPGTGGGRFRR